MLPQCPTHELHLTGFWLPASKEPLPTIIPVLGSTTPLVASLARPPFTCHADAFPDLTKISQFLFFPSPAGVNTGSEAKETLAKEEKKKTPYDAALLHTFSVLVLTKI